MEELMKLVQAYGKARQDTGRSEQVAHIARAAQEADELLERIRRGVLEWRAEADSYHATLKWIVAEFGIDGSECDSTEAFIAAIRRGAQGLSPEEAKEALALIDLLAWDNGATLADVIKDAEGLQASLLRKLASLAPPALASSSRGLRNGRAVTELLAAMSDVAPAVIASERKTYEGAGLAMTMGGCEVRAVATPGSSLEYTVDVASDFEHEAQRWQAVGRIGGIREVRYHADRKAAERKAVGAALETYGRMLREGA